MKSQFVRMFASLLIISLTYAVQAQNANPPRFGLKGGVNFSNLYTKDAEDTKMLTGFNIGLFGKLPITTHVSLQPELYFTTKGAEVTYNNAFVQGTGRFNFNYLEVPVLIVVHVTKMVNIQVGPYAAYLISGKAKNQSTVGAFNFEENINTDDYNKLDAGIAAGLGLDLGPLSIGARYNYGLTKVGKERSFLGTTYRFPDAVNGVISFYASVSLM